MPTGVTKGGSHEMIAAAAAGSMKRGVPSTKMKPSASAPASTATRASATLVIPQTFTLVNSALPSWLRPSARTATPRSQERQLAHLGLHVGGAHEPFADEDGVR